MTIQERKSIFAFCRELGINDEDRHTLTFGLTGKESLTELNASETKAVIHELMERMKLQNRAAPPEPRKVSKEKPRAVPGMMTAEQQSLAWRLVYRLQELDTAPNKATVAERMCGAIKKELGITAVPGANIFKWVSFEDGSNLIEKLKRYVRSAERRLERRTG